MRHLTTDEIERLADASSGPAPAADRLAHLASCAECREEVELVRSLAAGLARLERLEPSAGFADAVLRRIELPAPWLDRLLARLPALAPSPGFATAVLARVRLPAPWHERMWRFARRRRAALAGAAAATVATTAAAAAWLFGAQGLAPAQVVGWILGGVRDLAIRAALALGRFGYELGLLDAGGSIADRIDPAAALGGLAFASLLGLLSLWVMARLLRGRPETVELARAA